MTAPRSPHGLLARGRFVAAAVGLPSLLALAPSTAPVGSDERVGSALVLSGGGAHGAYEAGVIEGMRRAAGVADGQRIPGVDVVCGTSIGAINGWFLATAQYTALRTLWHGIGSDHIFRVKRRYAATTKHGAFVVTKLVESLSLVEGLVTNLQGVLDGDVVASWIEKHIDPQTPVLVPFVFAATNLDSKRAEIFYRLPFGLTDEQRRAGYERVRSSVGAKTAIWTATNALLRPALQASTALPGLFDPIHLATPADSGDRYIDGGIADNNLIDVARALSEAVYAVILEPVRPAHEAYRNALSIVVGSFGVGRTRMLEESLRSAYRETRAKRLFGASASTGEQRLYLASTLDADLYTLRPQSPFTFVDFDDQHDIDAAYDRGFHDIATGWTPYVDSSVP